MTNDPLTIRTADGKVTAAILAGCGFNCYRLNVMADGRPVQLIWSALDFATARQRPSGNGIPILFPFPGRIRGARLRWAGKIYQLREGDGRGNAIHGFVHERPWRVIEQAPDRVVGQFQASMDDPALLESWPADFRITAEYSVEPGGLTARYLIENPGDRPLPFGLGIHPYFRVPLGGRSAEQCTVSVPATERWELQQLIPTGRRVPLDCAASLQQGMPFGQMTFDDVLTGLQRDGDVCTVRIDDRQAQRGLVMTFDRLFRHCVVYTPPHRQAVCVEPYSCVPDPFRLADQGIDGGLRVLQPGEAARGTVCLRLQRTTKA